MNVSGVTTMGFATLKRPLLKTVELAAIVPQLATANGYAKKASHIPLLKKI